VNPVTARENGFFNKEAPIDMIYGRWIDTHVYENYEKLNIDRNCRKVVIDQDTSIHFYPTPSSPEYSYVGENNFYTIKESRIDSKGCYWYKVFIECPYAYTSWYELWRIDPSGSTLERVSEDADYPTDINPSGFNYSISHKMWKDQTVFNVLHTFTDMQIPPKLILVFFRTIVNCSLLYLTEINPKYFEYYTFNRK